MENLYRDINGVKLEVNDLVLYSRVSNRKKTGQLIWCRVKKLLENGSVILKYQPIRAFKSSEDERISITFILPHNQDIPYGILRSTSPSSQIYKFNK